MSLQGPGERSTVCRVRGRAGVQKLRRGTRAYVAVDLVLNAGSVAQLAVDRQRGEPIGLRDTRTVVGKSRGPHPFLGKPKLLTDGELEGIGEVQVGFDASLVGRRDSNRKLTERRPILPPDVAHHAKLRK